MTTYVGTRAADDFPVFKPTGSGYLAVAWGSYSIGSNVSNGDIFQMCKLPKNAIVVGGQFWSTDIDTGTEALDMDVGWAANGVENANYTGFVNSGVLTGDAITDLVAAGANFRPFVMSSGPISFTNETIVVVKANAAANAFAAGTIYVRVDFTVA